MYHILFSGSSRKRGNRYSSALPGFPGTLCELVDRIRAWAGSLRGVLLTQIRRTTPDETIPPKNLFPGLLTSHITYDICCSVGKMFCYTQHISSVVCGSKGSFRAGSHGWLRSSTVVAGRRLAIFLCWLRLSLRFMPYLAGDPTALERFLQKRQGHLRWWSYGAFGSKGRQEGGQYLAGRRAPPLLHLM